MTEERKTKMEARVDDILALGFELDLTSIVDNPGYKRGPDDYLLLEDVMKLSEEEWNKVKNRLV